MRVVLAGFLALTAVLPTTMARAQEDDGLESLGIHSYDGRCTEDSRIAVGPADEDLAPYRKPYACDFAVVAITNAETGRMLVQFLNNDSSTGDIVGFGGLLQGRDFMEVDGIYLTPGERLTPVGASCKFFLDGEKLTGVVCGGRVEMGDQAAAPIIAFEVGDSR